MDGHERNANTGVGAHRAQRQSCRMTHALNDARAQTVERLTADIAFHNDRELITAEARDEVLFAHHIGKPATDNAKQLITGLVAKRVVDLFEVVKIEKDQCGGVIGIARRIADPLQLAGKQRAVGQPVKLSK